MSAARKVGNAAILRNGGALIVLLATNSCYTDPLIGLTTSETLPTSYIQVNAQLCTDINQPTVPKTKFMFVLDHSSSNAINVQGQGYPAWDVNGTDPNGNYRYQPLVAFLNILDQNTAVANGTFLGLFDFSQGPLSATPDPNPTPTPSPTDVNSTAFLPLLTQIGPNFNALLAMIDKDYTNNGMSNGMGGTSPADGGETDYYNTLHTILSILQTDIQNEANNQVTLVNKVKSTYTIIFVSDGMPVIESNSRPGNLCIEPYSQPDFEATTQPVASPAPPYCSVLGGDIGGYIGDMVNAIIDLGTQSSPTLNNGDYVQNISINTVFYNPDPTTLSTAQAPASQFAQAVLKKMANASAGKGQALTFYNQEISYESFVPPVQVPQIKFVDFFLDNTSAVWWQGRMRFDSDGGGIPDVIKRSLGANPATVDSDGNGVSDLVEFRVSGGHPCKDPQCNPANRTSYSVCTQFLVPGATLANPVFTSSSNDGLNDCEKYVLGATRGVFSSSRDFVPDFYAFKNNLDILPGTSNLFADPFGDGLTNYQKLKAGMPTDVSNRLIGPFIPRSTSIVHLSAPSAEQSNDCYSLTISDVLVYGVQNVLKFYWVQSEQLTQNLPYLKTAIKVVPGLDGNVQLTSDDFH